MRFLVGHAQNALDLKIGSGMTTAEAYETWARKSGADVLTDELSEGATLNWIGPRRKDRVFLFLHGTPFFSNSPTWVSDVDWRGVPFAVGGCYILPARVDYFYMLESLRKEYKGAVGMAMLNYCASCNV
jgi:hypothetical protein